jgi:hypothetical protein
VKTVLVYMLVGAMLGAVAGSFIVPPVLAWYNTPGEFSPNKPVETLCNIPELIRYATSWMWRGQLIGAGVGAVLFFFPGFFAARRRREPAAPA